MLRVEKTGHSGTLDPESPRLDRVHRPRDAAGQGAAGRGEGVRLRRRLHRRQSGKAAVQRAIETFTGALFQRPL